MGSDWALFRKSKLSSLEEATGKGLVDEEAIPLVSAINANPSLVTSSSCAGRIALLSVDEGKADATFFAKWHQPINFSEFKKKLESYKSEKPLWLRSEPFILHVFAESTEEADSFLQLVRKLGVKRGGIQQLTPRVFIELIGTNSFSLPIYSGKKPLVSDEYLQQVVALANDNLEKNAKMLERMRSALSK